MIFSGGRGRLLCVSLLFTDHRFEWPSHQVPSVQALLGKDYSRGVVEMKKGP